MRGSVRPGVAIAAALFLLWGCGGSTSSPEGAVAAWLDALEARDTAAVGEAFTERTRWMVAEIEALSARTGHPAVGVDEWCRTFCGATVESSTLHGDSATVAIRLEGDVTRIPVVREGDGWRIEFSRQLHPALEMLRFAVRVAEADTTTAEPDTAGVAAPDTAAEPPLP